MKKTNLMMALFAALAMVFTGCKDEEIPALEYKSQGFIKGTLVGETSEGEDLNEQFTFSQYTGISSYYSSFENIEDEDFYSFRISRQDINNGGHVELVFTLDELNSTSTIGPDITFSFKKETNNQITLFDVSNHYGVNTKEITNLSFDENTGRLKGNFEIVGNKNSSGEDATISGEFDVIVKKIVE